MTSPAAQAARRVALSNAQADLDSATHYLARAIRELGEAGLVGTAGEATTVQGQLSVLIERLSD